MLAWSQLPPSSQPGQVASEEVKLLRRNYTKRWISSSFVIIICEIEIEFCVKPTTWKGEALFVIDSKIDLSISRITINISSSPLAERGWNLAVCLGYLVKWNFRESVQFSVDTVVSLQAKFQLTMEIAAEEWCISFHLKSFWWRGESMGISERPTCPCSRSLYSRSLPSCFRPSSLIGEQGCPERKRSFSRFLKCFRQSLVKNLRWLEAKPRHHFHFLCHHLHCISSRHFSKVDPRAPTDKMN